MSRAEYQELTQKQGGFFGKRLLSFGGAGALPLALRSHDQREGSRQTKRDEALSAAQRQRSTAEVGGKENLEALESMEDESSHVLP